MTSANAVESLFFRVVNHVSVVGTIVLKPVSSGLPFLDKVNVVFELVKLLKSCKLLRELSDQLFSILLPLL